MNILTAEVREGIVTETRPAIAVSVGAWVLFFAPRTRRGNADCVRWALLLPGEDAADVASRWRGVDGYGRSLEALRADVERKGKRARKSLPEGASVVPSSSVARPVACASCLRQESSLYAVRIDDGTLVIHCAACARGRLT